MFVGFESVEIFTVVLCCWAVDGQCGGAMLRVPVLAGSHGAARSEAVPLPLLQGQRRLEESLSSLEAPLSSSYPHLPSASRS